MTSNTDGKIIKALECIGFEVQRTSYDYLISSDQLSYLRDKELPLNAASAILKAFPDLFILHRYAAPLKAGFFVITDDRKLDNAVEIYNKYFPPNILVATEKEGVIVCRWLNDTITDSFKPLNPFFEKILR